MLKLSDFGVSRRCECARERNEFCKSVLIPLGFEQSRMQFADEKNGVLTRPLRNHLEL
jgi:hypothetical protein